MTQAGSLDSFSDLVEAAAAVVGETDLERVLRRLVTEAKSATGARYAALGVIGEHGVLSDFLYEGISEEHAAKIGSLPTGRGVLGAVIRLNKTIVLDDIADHPDTSGFPPHHPPMLGFLGVPVAVGDEAFGNLYLTEKPGGFSDQDVVIAEALSRIAGSAVQTARLQERLRRVAIVEDRQRIARELHDSVIQEMFAVGLGLQGLAQLVTEPHAEATLLDAVDRLDGSVESLRRYIFELSKPEGARQSLTQRLEELVSRMGSAYPATIELDIVNDEGIDQQSSEDAVQIITEALSNALRHSGAKTVAVRVKATDSECTIAVTDDGVGFDTSAMTSGMGLGNLRSRVKRLGGELSIVSSADEGTTVAATLPSADLTR